MQTTELAQIDLNLLHTFRVVVEEGGIGRAARVLGRTQPAITSRVQQLEETLGVKLFQRVGRGIVVSPVGRVIEARAREVLGGLQDIFDTARTAGGKPTGLLRVGALPTLSTYRLAPVLTELLDEYPELDFEVRHGLTQPQVDELLRGALDVVFSVGPPPRDPRLRVEQLGSARPVAVFASGLRGVPAGALPVARVASFGLVLFGKVGDLFFDAVSAFLEQHGLTHAARIRVAHIQTLKALVLAGSRASILPDYTVVEPELVARPLEGLTFEHPIWMATRAQAAEIPAVAELARYARNFVAHPARKRPPIRRPRRARRVQSHPDT